MFIQVTYTAKWQLKDYSYYKWTTCKKLINCKTGQEIKKVTKGFQVGYYINRHFISLKVLRNSIELIKENDCPF